MLTAIFILLAAVPALLFPIIYALTARWFISPMGRSVMISGTTKALILSLAVFHVLYGSDYPGREYLRPVVWGLIALMLWTQLVSYLLTLRQVRKKEKDVQ